MVVASELKSSGSDERKDTDRVPPPPTMTVDYTASPPPPARHRRSQAVLGQYGQCTALLRCVNSTDPLTQIHTASYSTPRTCPSPLPPTPSTTPPEAMYQTPYAQPTFLSEEMLRILGDAGKTVNQLANRPVMVRQGENTVVSLPPKGDVQYQVDGGPWFNPYQLERANELAKKETSQEGRGRKPERPGKRDTSAQQESERSDQAPVSSDGAPVTTPEKEPVEEPPKKQ